MVYDIMVRVAIKARKNVRTFLAPFMALDADFDFLRGVGLW